MILLPNRIGRIELLVIVICLRRVRVLIADAVNVNKSITHKADQFHLVVLISDIQDHNGVSPRLSRVVTNPAICSENEDIHSVLSILAVKKFCFCWLRISSVSCRQAFDKHENHASQDHQQENPCPEQNSFQANFFARFLRLVLSQTSSCQSFRLLLLLSAARRTLRVLGQEARRIHFHRLLLVGVTNYMRLLVMVRRTG